MAMCWIEQAINHHPNGFLKFQVHDFGRSPTVKAINRRVLDKGPSSLAAALKLPTIWGAINFTGLDDDNRLGPDAWYSVRPGQTVDLENCGIPWGGNQQALWVSPILWNGKPVKIQFDIVSQGAWDFIRIRDEDGREHGRAEVGSLGNAPGINHSTWQLVLHSDGKLELHCKWRQGLTRGGARELGAEALQVGGIAVVLGGSGME